MRSCRPFSASLRARACRAVPGDQIGRCGENIAVEALRRGGAQAGRMGPSALHDVSVALPNGGYALVQVRTTRGGRPRALRPAERLALHRRARRVGARALFAAVSLANRVVCWHELTPDRYAADPDAIAITPSSARLGGRDSRK